MQQLCEFRHGLVRRTLHLRLLHGGSYNGLFGLNVLLYGRLRLYRLNVS